MAMRCLLNERTNGRTGARRLSRVLLGKTRSSQHLTGGGDGGVIGVDGCVAAGDADGKGGHGRRSSDPAQTAVRLNPQAVERRWSITEGNLTIQISYHDQWYDT